MISGTRSDPLPGARNTGTGLSRRHVWLLAAALVIGALVRLPGVFWGENFPGGWRGHHPDESTHLVNAELILEPAAEPRWPPNPYPKGLAGLVAVPVIGLRALVGGDQVVSAPPPPMETLITAGRVVSLLMGLGTILLVWATTRRLFRDPRVPLGAAWFTALGGLHVTQSHFFVSDVPGTFALLLGLHLLLMDLQRDDEDGVEPMRWSAFAFGAAFGLKFFVAGLPSLGLVVLARRPRLRRAAHAAIFFLAGVVIVNVGYFTPWDFYQAFSGGTNDPYVYSRFTGFVLYLIELPSILGFPFLLLAILGTVGLARRVASAGLDRKVQVGLVVLLPAALQAGMVLLLADHFPRHLVPFIPWAAIPAAWALVRGADHLRRARIRPAWGTVPVFAYMTVFVVDGERVFIQDPRNEAAEWLLENLPETTTVWWNRHRTALPFEAVTYPEEGRPEIVVIEMLDANHYLRGMSLSNRMPDDATRIFDSGSQEQVEALQGLFTGRAGYTEIARFDQGQFMPEYVLTDRWIGDRSRSYVTDIVVFRRTDPDGSGGPG